VHNAAAQLLKAAVYSPFHRRIISSAAELSIGWVDPWVGLGLIGSHKMDPWTTLVHPSAETGTVDHAFGLCFLFFYDSCQTNYLKIYLTDFL